MAAGAGASIGFHSALAQPSSIQRNTLPVVVDHTTALREGDYVALRFRVGSYRGATYPTTELANRSS